MRCTFKEWGLFVALLVLLCACTKRALADMERVDAGSYAAIVWEERTYVPYCAVPMDSRGEQIGLVDGDKNDRIYEYRGYSTDEWLVNAYTTSIMDTAMLCRELHVTEIPDGLESEYTWNYELAHFP